MHTRIIATAALLLLAPGSAAAGPKVPSGGQTGYVVVPPDQVTKVNGADISNVIYLNRCVGGCTVTPGPNDARADTSSIPEQTVSLSEFSHSQQVWDDMVTCLQEVYAPFDVVFTETDPGDISHHEALVAGTTEELGFPGVLGVAPIAGGCPPLNNVISFTLANSHSASAQHLCWTVAQESAHAFGLDHEFDCHDPMTYISGCGQKFFRDAFIPCGRNQEEACICGGTQQNSHRKLLAVFGPGESPPAPTAEILLPADGGVVVNGFTVYAEGTDPRGNKRAELRINGYKWLEADADEPFITSNTYRFTTPDLPDGYQNIEVRIFNDLEVYTNASIQVLKGAPCTGNDTCFDGQSCADGACSWPAPTGELGDVCARNQDCISDLCPALDGEAFCSESCFPSVTDACPMEYECLDVGGGNGVCWPASGGGGGGCRTLGGDARPQWIQLVLFAAVVLLVSIRRRR